MATAEPIPDGEEEEEVAGGGEGEGGQQAAQAEAQAQASTEPTGTTTASKTEDSNAQEEPEKAKTAVALQKECADDDGEDAEEEADEPVPNFAELLGPDCVIKRVDKDKNVIGGAKPEEMQREMMARAQAQKRLGACAEHVKDMTREQKMAWAVDLKERANEYYQASNFEEASRLYGDCLVALDLDGTEEEVREVQQRVQLPVCTNLAACMVELGQYSRVHEICDIALGVDPKCFRALYRRGLASYRIGDHSTARPDFEAALREAHAHKEYLGKSGILTGEEVRAATDVIRRVSVYLGHIRRFVAEEKDSCKRMFERDTEQDGLYEDRPGAKPEEEPKAPIDDSDEAIEAALSKARGDWNLCPCRRRREKAD